MKAYTVRQMARLAGVSVRALHHYDHIGLLQPVARTTAGYRLYQEEDLMRLQQILFFKELDVPLADIRNILDDPAFDRIEALQEHRRLMQARAERLASLLHTIDKTIQKLKGEPMEKPMTDAELYEGFTQEQIERYQREAREHYDPALVRQSEQRVRRMSKTQWAAVKAEGDAVAQALAEMMGRDPADAEVQHTIAQHHAWVEQFYDASAEVYRGLGQLYAEHAEFRAFYDKYRVGLADFMCAAMAHYADHALNK